MEEREILGLALSEGEILGSLREMTSLIHSSNAEPHKTGHSVRIPLAQGFQLAAEHLV